MPQKRRVVSRQTGIESSIDGAIGIQPRYVVPRYVIDRSEIAADYHFPTAVYHDRINEVIRPRTGVEGGIDAAISI